MADGSKFLLYGLPWPLLIVDRCWRKNIWQKHLQELWKLSHVVDDFFLDTHQDTQLIQTWCVDMTWPAWLSMDHHDRYQPSTDQCKLFLTRTQVWKEQHVAIWQLEISWTCRHLTSPCRQTTDARLLTMPSKDTSLAQSVNVYQFSALVYKVCFFLYILFSLCHYIFVLSSILYFSFSMCSFFIIQLIICIPI